MPPEIAAERYERQTRFFGADGQRRIASARIAIVGLGGLGAHVAQQLAYLGALDYVLLDKDTVSTSNLNRLVGATPADAERKTPKVDVAERLVNTIQPSARVEKVPKDAELATTAHLERASVVFGCLDHDVPRQLLTQHCAAHGIPYFDLATDIGADGSYYGGRVVVGVGGNGCLSCLDQLDQRAIRRATMTPEQREADDKIYGVDRAELEGTGPSVVSLNGVVASLGVTEWMLFVTGKREPKRHLTYRADVGTVTVSRDEPKPECYYCKELWPKAPASTRAAQSPR